ncbi:MAG TPA: hypothetical protein PLM62_00320 [Zoogloea sp.]|jgi:hypothetical protein|nr:hypothetical protein [Zoogloea sp.]
MIEYNTYLQTASSIFSAIAAAAAAYTAKKAFTFQTKSLLKKAIIDQTLTLLSQLHYLKSLTDKVVFDVADEAIIGLRQRISETKANATALESMINAHASVEMGRIRYVVHQLSEEKIFANDEKTQNVAISRQLDEAINALHNIYHLELK